MKKDGIRRAYILQCFLERLRVKDGVLTYSNLAYPALCAGITRDDFPETFRRIEDAIAERLREFGVEDV